MHCPKHVSGAPVVLFALEFLFDWLSVGWGDNFPFPFSLNLSDKLPWALGGFHTLEQAYLSCSISAWRVIISPSAQHSLDVVLL
jgi:hypothetical protein